MLVVIGSSWNSSLSEDGTTAAAMLVPQEDPDECLASCLATAASVAGCPDPLGRSARKESPKERWYSLYGLDHQEVDRQPDGAPPIRVGVHIGAADSAGS